MKRIDANQLKGKGGFTLVELIVVLILMSMLAAVAVPSYLGFVDDNKAKQCEIHRKALTSRLEEMATMATIGGSETAALSDEDMNSEENGCPAGGTYTLVGGNTIHCDKHGDTTVILKSAGVVQADVDKVQTEAPTEAATNPPAPDNGENKGDEGNNGGGENSVLTPEFSIEIIRQKENMEIGDTQILNANVTNAKDCTPTNNYTWTVPVNFEVVGERSGASIMIKAVSAGALCNISCSSSAVVAEGDPILASANTQITVNEQKSLTVSLTPNSLELVLGEEGKESGLLTANVEVSGYDSYSCEWEVEKGEIVSVTKSTNDQTKASVTGLLGGTATVTCTVTADNGAATAIAMATVTVKEPETETEKSEVSSADILITAGNSTVERLDVWLNEGNCPDLKNLNLPSGGVWSSSDPNVTPDARDGQYGHVYIDDKLMGGTYSFTYTASNGDIYNITGRVVYPIGGLDDGLHHGTWSDDSEKREEPNYYEVNLGDKTDVWLGYTPPHTTDKGSITWKSSDESVAVIEQVRFAQDLENRGYSIVTLHTLKPGKTTIEMSVYNEYEKKHVTRSHEFTVVAYPQKAHLEPAIINLYKNESGQQVKVVVDEPAVEGLTLNITWACDWHANCNNGFLTPSQTGVGDVIAKLDIGNGSTLNIKAYFSVMDEHKTFEYSLADGTDVTFDISLWSEFQTLMYNPTMWNEITSSVSRLYITKSGDMYALRKCPKDTGYGGSGSLDDFLAYQSGADKAFSKVNISSPPKMIGDESIAKGDIVIVTENDGTARYFVITEDVNDNVITEDNILEYGGEIF